MKPDDETTVASVVCLAKLLHRVERSTDADARELAARVAEAIKSPDRRVGPALMPKPRGGFPQDRRVTIAQRDDAMRALARLCFADLRPEQQARELHRRLERFAATAWRSIVTGTSEERALQKQILEHGDGRVPKLRRTKAILAAKT